MPLPNSDPSLPANPSPIAQDNSFVRGDDFRLNNQAIWTNLLHVLNGDPTENFAINTLTANSLLTAKAKASIESALKMTFSNVEGVVITTDGDGSIKKMANVHEISGTIYLGYTGATGTQYASRIRQEGSNGRIYFEYFTGTANAVIADGAWTMLGVLSTANPLTTPGANTGGIELQSATTPPTIKAGCYEINGINFKITADYNLTLSNVLGSCSRTLTHYPYQWIFACIRVSDSARFWGPAYDITSPIGLGRTVTSVVVDGSGNATIYTTNTTGLVVADRHNIVCMGSSAGVISGQLTAVSAGTSVTVRVSNTAIAAGTYSGGTYDAYYRIYTQHDGGAGIITDADIVTFSPSPPFCQALNCYIVDQYGRPTSNAANVYARILGPAYVDGTGNVTEIISYKSGDDKNDNEFDFALSSNSKGTTNTNVVRWNGTTYRLWGSDYKRILSAANGDSLFADTDLFIDSDMTLGSSLSLTVFVKNGSSITNSITGGSEDFGRDATPTGSGIVTIGTPCKRFPKNYYVWVASTGSTSADATSTVTRWRGRFSK